MHYLEVIEENQNIIIVRVWLARFNLTHHPQVGFLTIAMAIEGLHKILTARRKDSCECASRVDFGKNKRRSSNATFARW